MNAKKVELISLNEAVTFLNEIHHNDPTKSGRDYCTKEHLYNCIYRKKIHRYGPRHFVQVDKYELEKIFGPKKATG
jgi:hypothetical protein